MGCSRIDSGELGSKLWLEAAASSTSLSLRGLLYNRSGHCYSLSSFAPVVALGASVPFPVCVPWTSPQIG